MTHDKINICCTSRQPKKGFACSIKATTPAIMGAAAEVPPKCCVQSVLVDPSNPCKSVVVIPRSRFCQPLLGAEHRILAPGSLYHPKTPLSVTAATAIVYRELAYPS